MMYILPTFMKTREKDILRDKVNSLPFFQGLKGKQHHLHPERNFF